MKILLVYPEYPETFWSFKHTLKFTENKAAIPPLGLLTVASLLPKDWEKILVDLNVEPLLDEHLEWADFVFLGAQNMQKKSTIQIIDRCKGIGVKIVAGGPLFTENYGDFQGIEHLVLGEAEFTLPAFLNDLNNGTPKHLYPQTEWGKLESSSAPLWSLLHMNNYNSMSLQYSRGCPFNCEFCQISKLFGREVRTKSKEHIIAELDSIYSLGWSGPVFFVDDNFIGNKHKIKSEILPAVIDWMEEKNYPFRFFTQASVNLADDEELMKMMAKAGFDCVFLGIETVDDDCLAEVGKMQNRKRNLIECVKKMQRFGLETWSGFIIGFDHDKETIFDNMIHFIQEGGITIAMVGLLSALPGTRLYNRLDEEKRLVSEEGECNDFMLNFIPKMDKEVLLEGYRRVIWSIYSPKCYYSTLVSFLKDYNPPKLGRFSFPGGRVILSGMKSFSKIIVVLGIRDKGRIYFWKLLFWTIFKRPDLFSLAIKRWAFGYHLRTVAEKVVLNKGNMTYSL